MDHYRYAKMAAFSLIKKTAYATLPRKKLAELEYIKEFMRKPDFKNPTRFTEKMWLLKLINGRRQKGLLQQCYDKYRVRDYVKEKLGYESKGFLNELYGVYNSADEIDFDALPDSFALKVTQSSGCNYLCPDKSKIDEEAVRETFRVWLDTARRWMPGAGAESYLLDGKARIIAEKLLVTNGGGAARPESFLFPWTAKAILVFKERWGYHQVGRGARQYACGQYLRLGVETAKS